MTTLYIAANFQSEPIPHSHCLGDVITSIKVAWVWIETEKPDSVIVSLCADEQWNCLWTRFIRETKAIVIWDRKAKNKDETYRLFDERRRLRAVNGHHFDVYKELYCRMEGGRRQHELCGSELGLGRKNIFEYFYYGQESSVERDTPIDSFGVGVLDFKDAPRERKVLIAPHAKCQGNHVFTFEFWREVVDRALEAGIDVTLNDNQDRLHCQRHGYDLHMSAPARIADYVASHSLVVCGNTGIGWVAGATGTPLFGMEPPWFNMMDFRYQECGVQSLTRLFAEPNAEVVADTVIEFMKEQDANYYSAAQAGKHGQVASTGA